jgi:hypothetical protein
MTVHTCGTCKGNKYCLSCNGTGKNSNLTEKERQYYEVEKIWSEECRTWRTRGTPVCPDCGGSRKCYDCNGNGYVTW